MAPMPTWDTSLPVHWVSPSGRYIARGHPHDGMISHGGWRSECDTLVVAVPYDERRRECDECAGHAEYGYHEPGR